MIDNTPSPNTPYDRPPVRERILALRETVNKRRGPNPPKATRLEVDDNSSPCDGWFLASEQFLVLAIEAEDDEHFQKFSDLADAFETAGEGCEALLHTL